MPDGIHQGFFQNNPELKFAWETLKKVFVFVVIALSAVGLHAIIEALQNRTTIFILGSLTLVEYAILFVDVVWFMRALIVELISILTPLASFFKTAFSRVVAIVLLFVSGALLSPYITHWLRELLQRLSRI